MGFLFGTNRLLWDLILLGRSKKYRMAQWQAYWAHNPEVRGSKPRSAIFLHQNKNVLLNLLNLMYFL